MRENQVNKTLQHAAALTERKPAQHIIKIPENCLIEKAIIDEHCHIGNNVQLINRDKKKTLDGDGVYIRDGIIIVTSGATLPDNYDL